MKPFILFLLLIVSGIFFAALTRPPKLLIEAVRNLGHLPDSVKAKLQAAAARKHRTATGGDRWRPAAQF